MALAFERVRNPVLDDGLAVGVRDPAILYHDGLVRCFFTRALRDGDRYQMFLELSESPDLVAWSEPIRLTTSELNFSSPGNVIRAGDEWVLCVQSYPVAPGKRHGDESSRLWLMRSRDLRRWTDPQMIYPQGCQAKWSESRRQIDAYLVEHDGRFWCFYKTAGQIGLLVSDDLAHWAEASPDRPVLAAADTPDGMTVENACVVRADDRFALFFSPCRAGRGVGLAYSDDLIRWHDVHYVDFPKLPWAENGPTAAAVTDLRDEAGRWLMVFHGERPHEGNRHSAALALAWSPDLEHWTVP